ncbi:MAG: hypothetical protein WCY09_05460 [Candidatus Omnitrophota bacterium]
MLNNLEKIIRFIYREWKTNFRFVVQDHLSEEDLICFLENKFTAKDKQIIQKHLVSCDVCAEYISVQLKIKPHLSLDVSKALLEKIEKLVMEDVKENLIEIFLKLKDQALEIIQTTGDVLVGQELVPAPVLRSRQINEFKEEVSILKDLKQVRILAKITNKNSQSFNLTITVKDKVSQKFYEGLRITLIKDTIELESYIVDSGNSFFENILPGEYVIQVSKQDQNIAVINLKVKV